MLSAVGTVFACIAIPGYLYFLVIPAVFTFTVVGDLELKTSKYKFLLLVVLNFVVGLALRLFLLRPQGGVNGLGAFIAIISMSVSGMAIHRIIRNELALSLKGEP